MECELNNNIFNKNLDCTFYQTIKISYTNYIISTQQIPKNNYIMLITNKNAVKHIFKCKKGDIFFMYIFSNHLIFNVPFELTVIVDIKSQSN